MPLPKELTTVTPFSKALALIFFVTLPILGFVFGASYQRIVYEQNNLMPTTVITPTQTPPTACTEEAKICPDGSAVGRTGPKCEFAPCKESFCGGIAGVKCPPGYVCQSTASYPDAGGTCTKESSVTPSVPSAYTCPSSNYVDCMPGPDKAKSECNPEYLQWAQENCPDFKGAAY